MTKMTKMSGKAVLYYCCWNINLFYDLAKSGFFGGKAQNWCAFVIVLVSIDFSFQNWRF